MKKVKKKPYQVSLCIKNFIECNSFFLINLSAFSQNIERYFSSNGSARLDYKIDGGVTRTESAKRRETSLNADGYADNGIIYFFFSSDATLKKATEYLLTKYKLFADSNLYYDENKSIKLVFDG